MLGRCQKTYIVTSGFLARTIIIMAASCHWHSTGGFSLLTALVLAVMLILGPVAPVAAQQGETTPDSLFVALFSNGDALIEYDLLVTDPEAESVTVQLFGTNINDLIVTDFEDRILNFTSGVNPGEVVIVPAGAVGARISYTTPDLIGKERNVWTLAIDSPIGFSVKMPPDSVVIDWGDAVPGIIQVGDQTLITFKSGSKEVKYIIGSLGTEEQASITIKLVETTIKQTNAAYPGIVLTETESLLARAVAAKDEAKFADAERLAAQANDVARTTIREYQEADEEIEKSQDKIDSAAGTRDVVQARALLGQANGEFAKGSYVEARTLAVQAASAIGDAQQFPFAYLGVGVAAAAAGAFVVFRKKLMPAQTLAYKPERAARPEPVLDEPEPEVIPDESAVPIAEPAVPMVPESHTDTGLLGKIVGRIFEEKPHLRQEDRDVLQFLAEKEGAAFESEVRTRFQLPKTTVWRLVKRLEREELVEIRKAGGQNLIKLRFEGRQP
jgi:hypothetical protein